jgi:hypothetical protein
MIRLSSRAAARPLPDARTLTALVVLVTSLLSAAPALAQRSIVLFPNQARIEEPPGASGLVRLPLGPEVLAGAAADLGDVRVHDAAGDEVPYAIDRGDQPYPSSTRGESRVVVAFDAREETHTVAGTTTSTETYRLRPPTGPSHGGTWELVIEPEAGELVRQVVVRAEPPFGESREVTRTSIFRFARYGNERLAIPLPGVWDEPLAVELRGEGLPIHPRFLLREVERNVTEPATVEVPLTIRESRREGTRTLVVVERPRGYRTASITLGSSTASFVRNVEVRAPTPGGSVPLGSGGLVRVAGLEIPELRTVRLWEGGGDVLEIAIEDGDSPALADLTVTAALRVPALLFDPGRASALRWGGHRARAPHYDLMSTDVASLVRGRALVTAGLGPIEPNPEHDDTPALSFAMRAGQPVALERYTHRAPLEVPQSRDGLSRFAVPADVWAAAREDLGDLRVIDAEGRQWPYLFTSAPGNDELEASVESPTPREDEPRHTIHHVRLPARAVSPTTVRVELAPQLVARSVSARGRNERGEEVELGVGSFLSNEDAPARLELSLFGERITELWLDVDNGDEAPLAIERVTLVQSAHEVQLVASAGDYQLVVGDLEASAPAYDLGSAWELLGVLEAEDAVLGALVANPGFHEPTFFERSGWETIVLSVVLGLVVLVLFGLTLRIARSESGPAPSEVTAPRRDGKANDAKADDAKADDAKPDDAKPDDAKADDAKADDAKPDDAKPEGDVPPESGGA